MILFSTWLWRDELASTRAWIIRGTMQKISARITMGTLTLGVCL